MLQEIEIIQRISKSCGHDQRSSYDLYLTPDADDVTRDDAVWVEPMSMELRAINRGHLPYGYEGDWKVVRVCRLCDALRLREWNSMHWYMSPYERQIHLVRSLAAYEPKGGGTLTQEDQEMVLQLCRVFEITPYDFKLIDEQPYNYHVEDWHWKLRQTRNSTTNKLFDVLKENETEGTGDDYCIPKMLPSFMMD